MTPLLLVLALGANAPASVPLLADARGARLTPEERLEQISRHPPEGAERPAGPRSETEEGEAASQREPYVPPDQRNRFEGVSRRSAEQSAGATTMTVSAPGGLDLLDSLPDLPRSLVRQRRAAVRAQPRSPGAWVDLGNAYARAARGDQASRCYQEAIALDAAFAPAWNNLGGMHLRAYRNEEALEAFERALELAPDNALANYNAGIAHDRLGHYAEALDSYQRALELDPDLGLASVNPNIVNNEHLLALKLRLYRDKGGSLALPLVPGTSSR